MSNVFILDDGTRSNRKSIGNMKPGEMGWYTADDKSVRLVVLKVTQHTAVIFDNRVGTEIASKAHDDIYVEILPPGAKFIIEVR